MADAKVTFWTMDDVPAGEGLEQFVRYTCPRTGVVCPATIVVIEGRYDATTARQVLPWNGDREAPTFTGTIECRGAGACGWKGAIEAGQAIETV